MNRYHCSISSKPPFNFTAYQYGKAELPEAVGVATLERKVGPSVRETEQQTEVQIVSPDGKTTTEIRKTRHVARIGRLATGRAVIRNVLEVEAESEADAAAAFRRAVGINDEGTSRKVEVKLVTEQADEAPSSPAPAKGGKKGKPSADEAARQILGGKVPVEE